jgi:uncharacterized protein YbjT (DUF2867 family)
MLMKNVTVIGGNGMIGNLILQSCLQKNEVAKVTSIVRKSTGRQHDKLNEIIHTDFLNFSLIEEALKGQDVCFFCVGVYTGQVPTDEFKKITVDYIKAFATVLKKASPASIFCFLSGQGADSKEKSSVLFAREKGKAENILIQLDFERTHIFRPGYIYPVTPRKEPNTMYKMMRIFYKPISFLFPNNVVTSEKLANKMIEVCFGESRQIIFENKEIRLLGISKNPNYFVT